MGNAYDNASLIVTPNAYKASKIYALKPTDGSGDLSFTRAGSKMVRNSAGLWETIGTNIPPLSYPVGGGCPSWLFEAEAENIFLSSEFTENTNWFPLNCSKVLNSIQSPKDGFLATKVVEDTSNDIHINLQVKEGGSNANHTISFYAKTNGRNIGVFNNGSGDPLNAVFDLTAGTVSGTGSPTITDAGNGWWLCTCQYNPSISTYNIHLRLLNGTTASYLGDGVSGVYIWNTQMETGSAATSPIITAGSSMTRLKDVPQIFTSINGLTNFSVFFDITPTLLNNTMLFGSYSSGGTNSYLYYTSANSFLKRKDGTELNIGAHGMTLGTRYKIGYVVSGTTIKYFRNGALIFTSTIDGTLFDLASIWSSKDGGGSILPIRGICKDSILYQTALSDSEAIELTTL